MREIKFRAWGKNSKEFLCYYESDKKITGLTLKNIQNIEDLDTWELTQFTGLLDKNGKEIYEGDIVQTDYNEKYKAEVYWGEEGLWGLKWNKEGKNYNYRMFACEKLKIIGNIYENPELLSESNT